MFVYCFFGFWFFAKGFPGIESSWVPPGLYLTFIIVLDCVPFSLEYNLSESLITGTFLPGNAFFLDYHNFVFKVPILSYVISPFRYLSHRKVAFFCGVLEICLLISGIHFLTLPNTSLMNPKVKWSLYTKLLSLPLCRLVCWWWSDPFQNNFSPLGLLVVEVVSRTH